MKVNVKVLGRQKLKKGFSYNPHVMNAGDIIAGINTVSDLLKSEDIYSKRPKIISTSITSPKDFDFYIPTVIKYSETTEKFLDPEEIFYNRLNDENLFLPSADFVVFNKNQNVACITYSKDAPVIVFEGIHSGIICVGAIIRSAIKNRKISAKVFNKIRAALNDSEIEAKLVICTDYEYPDTGSLIELLCTKLEDIGITLNCEETVIPSKKSNKWFTRESKYCNCIAIY